MRACVRACVACVREAADSPRAARQVRSAGNEQVIVCERGTAFGYDDLLVDPRNLVRALCVLCACSARALRVLCVRCCAWAVRGLYVGCAC